MDILQIILVVTITTTKVTAPKPDNFAFWFDPLFFNFGLGLLFVAIPAKLNMGSPYTWGMLFFAGCFLGGVYGIVEKVTPWYDPVFFGAILMAFILLRAYF